MERRLEVNNMQVIKKTNNYEIYQTIMYDSTVTVGKFKLSKIEFFVEMGKQPVESIKSVYERTKADFIINGGLYASNTGGTTAVAKDGKNKYGDEGFYYCGYALTSLNNILKFIQLKDWNDIDKYKYVIETAPSLVKNSEINIDTKGLDNSFISDKSYNPRSAVGINSEYLFIVAVDGRIAKQERGVSIYELSKIMLNLGCTEAGNLDGGYSTQVLFDGEKITKTKTDRKVDNFLCVRFLEDNKQQNNKKEDGIDRKSVV
jgi:exopolysaccharide biosynthesis protein